MRIEGVDLWGWNPSLQLEVENINMLSQLLQVHKLIQTQFQDKHVCTQCAQGRGSLTLLVKCVFSSISRERNLENLAFTVTGPASKLAPHHPSPPQAHQSVSKGMPSLHPEVEGDNSLNTDQTQDFSILWVSPALSHLSSLGCLKATRHAF